MGLIALKAGVFPEPRAFEEGRILLVSEFLVVFLTLAGRAQCLDLQGASLGDEVVLDRVPLLLAAVVPPLAFGVLGGWMGRSTPSMKNSSPSHSPSTSSRSRGLRAGGCCSRPNAAFRTGARR